MRIINFLKSLFKNDLSINYKRLELVKALKIHGEFVGIKKYYFLGGFEYLNQNQINNFMPTIKVIQNLIDNFKYDVTKNNIEIYRIETIKEENFIVLLFSPFELYENSQILKIYEASKDFIFFSEKEI
jgi:virulence-associated protein VapD